ncbi:MAG: UrcA family protein [Pseudomonadota bacterium]
MPVQQNRNGAIIIASLIATFAGLGGAAADEVMFEYRASELNTAASIEALYARIEKRAANRCRSHVTATGRNACTQDLIVDFVDGIDHPKLTAHHESNGRRFADNRY